MLKRLRCSVLPNCCRSFRFSIIFLFLVVILATITSHAQNDIYTLSPKQQLRASSSIILHHSFTPPLLQHYYGEGEIPFWKFSGSTVITNSYIRLTTHNTGDIGHLWNKEPVDMDAFEIVIGFRVFSSYKEKRLMTDGFAFWITQREPEHAGPILGHPMPFVGLGIIFNNFDNDRRSSSPIVGVLYNHDETEKNRRYSPERNFRGEYKGFCNFDYLKPSSSGFATARIRYDRGHFQVFLSGNDEKDEKLCVNLFSIKLGSPRDRYSMGLTAQTGGVACNHDIVFFHYSPLEGATYDSDIHKPLRQLDELSIEENVFSSRDAPDKRSPAPTSRQEQREPHQHRPNPQDTKRDDSARIDSERLKELERKLQELGRAHAEK